MKNVQILRPKTYHMANKVNQQGGVSALCFATPRAIDLSRALWTNRPEAVTCPKCRALLNQGRKGASFGGLAVDCFGPNGMSERDADAEQKRISPAPHGISPSVCQESPAGGRSEAELRQALEELREAANALKYVALKPEIYTAEGTKTHSKNLIAALDRADAVLAAHGVSASGVQTFSQQTPMRKE